MYPKVSVLVVHVNGEQILDNCLNSLKQTTYPNMEVVVLLNASTDNSEQIAKKHGVTYYISDVNLGYAGGNNFLINETDSDYFVLMNNDIEVEKTWLSALVLFAEKEDSHILQPKILALKNKKMFEYAGAAGGFMDKYGYPFCRGRIFNTLEEDKDQYDKARRIFWACGCCIMIKRSLLKKIDLLDEDFFMYSEEMDLCWRANLMGGRIYCVPSSVVYHLGKFTIKKEKMNKTYEYLLHRNVFMTFLQNSSKKTIKKLIIKKIFLELASGLAYPRKMIPIAKSFLWIIKNRDMIRKKHRKMQKARTISEEEIQKLQLRESIVNLYFLKGKKTFKEVEGYF